MCIRDRCVSGCVVLWWGNQLLLFHFSERLLSQPVQNLRKICYWWFDHCHKLLLWFSVFCLLMVVWNTHHCRQIHPWSICTTEMFSFGSWHCLQRLPVTCNGFLQQIFLSLKLHLIQILCSLKSTVSDSKKISKLLKHNLTIHESRFLLSFEQNKASSQLHSYWHTDSGRFYCSPHLSAQGHSPSSLCALFKFPEIFCSTCLLYTSRCV